MTRKYRPFKDNDSKESERRLAENMLAGGAKCLIMHNADFRFYQKYELPNGEVVTVELKDETRQADTGNLIFELRQGQEQKPSGLAISQADITIHERPNTYELFDTKSLLAYVSDCAATWPMCTRRCGDNNNWGVLRPLSVLTTMEFHENCDKLRVAIAAHAVMSKRRENAA